MHLLSNLSSLSMGKKLNGHYGFISIYHCLQVGDFKKKKFPGQNNSIFMIWKRHALSYLTRLFDLVLNLFNLGHINYFH